mmetsp:Transcript_33789/g.49059  ORF Transcript_33789/g.49059 Transcript_33789/m.49059 type:complete len:495 (+) Transcript_33789:108-1592(+)
MSYSVSSFDESALNFALTKAHKWISLDEGTHDKLYNMLLKYIPRHLAEDENQPLQPSSTASYSVEIIPPKSKSSSKFELEGEPSNVETTFGRMIQQIGYGQHKFRDFDGKILHCLHQKIGDPVGTDCGVKILSNLVVFTEYGLENLCLFFTKLLDESEKSMGGVFTCYTWHIRHQYWRKEVSIQARPVQSVVLPEATKTRLIADLEKFLLPTTQSFYNRNGIPYRRSYLFYGLPGTGKTSMVQALAGHFNRNVCYLMPTHPDMTDDSLRAAVTGLPHDSIVVFEDIDSLFSQDRSNKVSKSSLTFSGLLNALDGITNSNGQIFILTTNLREQLDQALIRNGRVDMHIEFTYAVSQQMEQMWNNFYPDNANLALEFSKSLQLQLTENNLQVTASGLQHFFIAMMESTAEEALKQVGTIITEINENNSKEALEALQAATSKKDSCANDSEDDEGPGTREVKTKSCCCEQHALSLHVTVLLTAVAVLALSALHMKNV